jgi:CBS-domain-containing membrane protein
MWERDCGVIPVVDEDDKVVGMITDRDICMAAALTGRDLSNLDVGSVISGLVTTCKSEDDVQSALTSMRENQLRRLPVIDADGKLQGVLSLNDLVLKAERDKDKKTPGLTYIDVIDTYRAICQHRTGEERVRSATATAS